MTTRKVKTAASVVAFRVLNREPEENQKVLVPLYFPTEAHIGAAIVSMHRVLKSAMKNSISEPDPKDLLRVIDLSIKLIPHADLNVCEEYRKEVFAIRKLLQEHQEITVS